MARAQTSRFEEYILEVESTATPGTWSAICGMTDVTTNHTSNVDTSEIPDCDDESLPLSIERQIRSQEVTVSATGVWAAQSHQNIMTWWRTGLTRNTRLRYAYVEANGALGDTFAETGPAILVSLSNSRTKGKKVTAEIEIHFDGVPAAEAKAV